jgi:hypothetical protein
MHMTRQKFPSPLYAYVLALSAMACGSDAASGKGPEASALNANPSAQGGSGATPESLPSASARGQADPEQGSTPVSLSPGSTAPTVGSAMSAAPSGAAGSPSVASAADAGGVASNMGGAAGETSVPAASPFPSSVQRPQIMIVGDSISAGPGCYKKYLLGALNTSGYTNFDFIGEYTDDCGGSVRHSARSCSTAEQYTQPTFTLAAGSCNPSGTFPGLSQLMLEYRPDLLMIQLGVNDAWGGRATDAILASYTTLVQQARAQNPNVVIAVAQIQQIRPAADGDAVFARAQQLIAAVPGWASAQSQSQSPVFVADLWTNSNPAETLDGVHPDDAGAQRMGLNWFSALRAILKPD